jgi:lysyl-tRNA synthetase class 2
MNGRTGAWWQAGRHADRRPRLLARNRILTEFRRWFEAHAFIEVDTPVLQTSPGNEAHLHALATDLVSLDGVNCSRMWLHTSPEFACKKLLTAGERRIFTFAHVFRNREHGPLHQPEFTMLEWYRAKEPYEILMTDCAALLRGAAQAAGTSQLCYRGRAADPFAEPERLTVAEAFWRFGRIDLLSTVDGSGNTDLAALATQASAAGIRVAGDDNWSDIFSRVMVAVEPGLGIGRATILSEYPTAEAALARPTAHDARVSERFELYVCGVELANAFGELTDPVEQRRRFELEMNEKERVYGERYPIDEDFLTALGSMPDASGIAMGFDRLVMLATGASHIAEVIWAPLPRS